jgi:hypothetical protein
MEITVYFYYKIRKLSRGSVTTAAIPNGVILPAWDSEKRLLRDTDLSQKWITGCSETSVFRTGSLGYFIHKVSVFLHVFALCRKLNSDLPWKRRALLPQPCFPGIITGLSVRLGMFSKSLYGFAF